MASARSWRIFVDTGGTFTDALGLGPGGARRRVKILSSGALRGVLAARLGPSRFEVREEWNAPPGLLEGCRFRLLARRHPERRVAHYDGRRRVLDLSGPIAAEPIEGALFELVGREPPPLFAARLLTGAPHGAALRAGSLRLATTLGTNALLERRGVKVALFITRGFADLLRIGTQQRPDLFALEIRRPEPLYAAVVEVDERLDADGSVLIPFDPASAAARAASLLRRGIRSAAVGLLHSYRNPAHERALAAVLTQAGFSHVSLSSDLAPAIRALPRTRTAVIDAYLAPLVGGYLKRVIAGLAGGRLHVMTSAGGLVSPAAFRPKDSLLSGPAAGVVGAAEAGRRSGFDRLVAFDMGGTSTDVARFDGEHEYVFEHQVGDARLLAPALAIESVAAGGGSICWFDGDRLRVGSRSAGAAPGPACYGAGGPLTLTDVNLLLGRLDPQRFGIPIDPAAAARALAGAIGRLDRRRAGADRLLEGFVAIADERMADAIRRISLRRGYDPAGHALVAFGGAGGQHACGVAERLGITTVLVPPDAGLLSAAGLEAAGLERFAEEQVLRPLAEVEPLLPLRFRTLARRCVAAVAAEGAPRASIRVRRLAAHLRLAGQDAAIEVPYRARRPLGPAFARRYARLFGHPPPARAIEIESLRAVASAAAAPRRRRRPAPGRSRPAPTALRRARFDGAWRRVAAFDRADLRPGATFDGPALVFERHGATVVRPGWRAAVDAAGAIVLRRVARGAPRAAGPAHEAIRLELFTNRFRAVVEEMGERLGRTAISTNVKERLDYSCALLDARGELVVNAPHIPVHLGALGLCVRRLRDTMRLGPGDVVVTNHPGFGGSHLPDVTVVTPVHLPGAPPRLLGYVASRAHHAEIGGSSPGSMPPAATTLAEEAVVIPPTYLARRGRPAWETVRRILESGPFPSRAVADNLADLRAAVAANHAGAGALCALAAAHGAPAVRRYMAALTALAERRMRTALRGLPAGRLRAIERLDDGTVLRVALEARGGRLSVDFAGSAPTHTGNLNATPAIVNSVVIYVMRLLLREPLPLNEGLLRPVTIRLAAGLLNPDFGGDPRRCPAVAAGNVETSQRLVDTLLKALRLAACSQGTMNNVLFGNESFGYYETLGGGCGAGPGFDGASAVHSHMTNTRLTDPEVIEHRYPVRVERFAIRRGSGGRGRRRGGDGVVREIVFLDRMTLSVISQHRTERPYGMSGGGPGLPGAQRILRRDGSERVLGSLDGCPVGPGDRLIIETPGGGGFGRPAAPRP